MNSTIEKSPVDYLHKNSGDMTSLTLDATKNGCDSRFKYLKVELTPFLIDRRFASQLDEII